MRQHQADLGPGEHPGDGAQALEVAGGRAPRRAAAECERREFCFGGNGLEKVDEFGSAHAAAVGVQRKLGEFAHAFAHGGARRWRRVDGGVQGCG